jgi:hypothetical protein
MVRAGYLAETFFIIILASALTLFFVFANYRPFKFNVIMPTLPNNTQPSPTPQVIQEPQSSFWLSSDGTTNLHMLTTFNKDKTKTYSFLVGPKDGTEHSVFTKTVAASDTITIPFNSWSPDNKYFFVKDVENGVTNYLVLKASGEAFANGQQYLNASEIFDLKKTGNTLQEVTGWASPTLLLANSITPNQASGPSYWIEIPSKAVIQLATKFE